MIPKEYCLPPHSLLPSTITNITNYLHSIKELLGNIYYSFIFGLFRVMMCSKLKYFFIISTNSSLQNHQSYYFGIQLKLRSTPAFLILYDPIILRWSEGPSSLGFRDHIYFSSLFTNQINSNYPNYSYVTVTTYMWIWRPIFIGLL